MDAQTNRELLLQCGNAFVNRNGMRVVSVGEEGSEAELDITEDVMNPFGVVHGGALFTLADLCCGAAARVDGRHYVTDQASISYLRAVSEGKVHARGTVLHRGRSRCIIDVKIYDGQGRLVCAGTLSFFCTG